MGDVECFDELYEWEKALNIAQCCTLEGTTVASLAPRQPSHPG